MRSSRSARHSGWCASGRRQGRAPSRCDSSDLAIETAGGIATPMIARNTTIPKKTVADLFDLRGQPARRGHRRSSGRAADVQGQQAARNLQARRHPAAAARRASDRGDFRHRCQRNSQCLRQGQGDRQRAEDFDHGSSGLTDEEIEKAKREAEENAEADKKREV